MNFVDNCLQTLGLLVLSARSIRSTPMELQGKVDICVNLPMPTKEEKIQLFKATVACVQCDENIDWEALAAGSLSWSPFDTSRFCKSTCRNGLERWTT